LLAGKKGDGILKTHLGTISYACPEILSHKDYKGSCADVFSIGVILFVLVTGKLPFGKAHISDPMYKMIAKGEYENYWKVMSAKINPVSDDLKSLLNLILAFDPLQRPSISEIKFHPWTLGSTATNQELQKEFEERKEIVVQLKALEAAQEKTRKKQQNTQNKHKNVVYKGETVTEKNFEFFNGRRFIRDYDQENEKDFTSPFKFAVEGEEDHIEFLNSLCETFGEIKENNKPEIKANEKNSKFTVSYNLDSALVQDLADFTLENLKVEVNVEKIQDNWYMVYLNKVSGDKHEFYEVFDEIVRKYSPTVEESKN
jgi:serine/threonine protein kinase